VSSQVRAFGKFQKAGQDNPFSFPKSGKPAHESQADHLTRVKENNMRTSRFVQPIVVLAAFLSIVSAFLLVHPPQALAAQEGNLTYVSSSPDFYQKGGDCA
jgi:hypothetical protein